MSVKFVVVSIFLLVLMSNSTYAIVQVNESVDGKEFRVGDVVDISFSITNHEPYLKTYTIISSLMYPKEDFVPMPVHDEVTLNENESYVNDNKFVVSEAMPPGEYEFSVLAFNKYNFSEREEKVLRFRVVGTKKEFSDVLVEICEDKNCTSVSDKFFLGEGFWVRVQSNENPHVDLKVEKGGEVVFSGSDKNVFKVMPNESGEYRVQVRLSKEGYRSALIERNVTVFEGEMKLHYFACNEIPDGVCDEGCPFGKDVDCTGEKGEARHDYSLVSLVVLLLIIITVLIVFRVRGYL